MIGVKKILVCDACGKPVDDDEGILFIRAKRRIYSWMECSHVRARVCFCARCQEKLRRLMEQEG